MNSSLPAAMARPLIYSAQVMSSLTSPTCPRLNLQIDSTVRLLLVEAQVACILIYPAAKCMVPVRVYFVSTCAAFMYNLCTLTHPSTVKICTYCRYPTLQQQILWLRNDVKANTSYYYHVFTV